MCFLPPTPPLPPMLARRHSRAGCGGNSSMWWHSGGRDEAGWHQYWMVACRMPLAPPCRLNSVSFGKQLACCPLLTTSWAALLPCTPPAAQFRTPDLLAVYTAPAPCTLANRAYPHAPLVASQQPVCGHSGADRRAPASRHRVAACPSAAADGPAAASGAVGGGRQHQLPDCGLAARLAHRFGGPPGELLLLLLLPRVGPSAVSSGWPGRAVLGRP